MYVPLAEIEAQRQRAQEWQTDRVRLAGAKVFADGTLNSKTAWMLEPYADPLPGMERGKVITTATEIRSARERTLALGLGLAVHAIGDAAVRAVLDVEAGLRASRRQVPVPALRVEHCELIDQRDVARFADLGVVASVQPCHLLADIEVLVRQLPHRLDRVLPLRELIDAGCVPGKGLIFGSDTPIVRPHPHDSIQAAAHRRREGMSKGQAIAPDQAITEAEAWACFS
jgi:predicted amidohydrolase YtcJ